MKAPNHLMGSTWRPVPRGTRVEGPRAAPRRLEEAARTSHSPRRGSSCAALISSRRPSRSSNPALAGAGVRRSSRAAAGSRDVHAPAGSSAEPQRGHPPTIEDTTSSSLKVCDRRVLGEPGRGRTSRQSASTWRSTESLRSGFCASSSPGRASARGGRTVGVGRRRLRASGRERQARRAGQMREPREDANATVIGRHHLRTRALYGTGRTRRGAAAARLRHASRPGRRVRPLLCSALSSAGSRRRSTRSTVDPEARLRTSTRSSTETASGIRKRSASTVSVTTPSSRR